MKILIVRTFPSLIQSSSYNIQEIGLAKALTKAGHSCGIVFYNGKNKDSVEHVLVSGMNIDREIIIYRLHGYKILKNGFFPALSKIVKEYDVVQVHEYDQITSWLFYAWSKKPVIIYHGPYYHPFNKGYNKKCLIFDHTFLKIRHNKKTVCLTKSHSAKRFLSDKGFLDVTDVGVGLDTDNFPQKLMIENSNIIVPENKFNLIYVGKIEERRNPYFLLEIMTKISERQKNINCIIIGNGETEYVESFLNKAATLIQTGRLQYYSKASQQELASVYQKVQLMLFPTHYDIFGMVLLEALYFNLPVMSTHNGGSDMLIKDGENGWILSDKTTEEWCNQIEELYNNNEKYNRIHNRIASEDHTNLCWDGLAGTFIEAYNRAIAQGVSDEK